jgi:hypothetical protein
MMVLRYEVVVLRCRVTLAEPDWANRAIQGCVGQVAVDSNLTSGSLRQGRCWPDTAAGGLEDGVKGAGEVRSAAADQELDVCEPLVEAEGQVAGLLHGPLARGVRGNATEVHPAGAVLDEHQDSVECSFVAVHRIRVTWESSQVRTAFGRQSLPRSDST